MEATVVAVAVSSSRCGLKLDVEKHVAEYGVAVGSDIAWSMIPPDRSLVFINHSGEYMSSMVTVLSSEALDSLRKPGRTFYLMSPERAKISDVKLPRTFPRSRAPKSRPSYRNFWDL